LPEFLNGCVHAVLKINERISGPKANPNLFPGNYFARSFKKYDQDLEGLSLQLDSYAVPAQLAGAQIHLKRAKLHDR
jgi:hypothetical protein